MKGPTHRLDTLYLHSRLGLGFGRNAQITYWRPYNCGKHMINIKALLLYVSMHWGEPKYAVFLYTSGLILLLLSALKSLIIADMSVTDNNKCHRVKHMLGVHWVINSFLFLHFKLTVLKLGILLIHRTYASYCWNSNWHFCYWGLSRGNILCWRILKRILPFFLIQRSICKWFRLLLPQSFV